MPFNFRLNKRSQQYNVVSKDLFVIPIELLTNECIECTLFASSTAQECLDNVCQKLGIQQSEYFSFLFRSKKNIDQWVDLSKPLKKQLNKHALEIRLYFRLQFFVPNFHFLSDEVSRFHYFCAMKNLVIDGRIACNRDDAILLASFSMQAEFGDYIPERHTVEYLNNFALFPKSMIISKIAKDVLIECAINAYRNLQGVPPSVAEIYYISEAQRREGYGQEGFPAKDLSTGQDVCLGVCIRGIFTVDIQNNTLELFKWMDITNLMHNKKVFTIERYTEKYSKNYSTFDNDYASCIWQCCVEQHQYFMKGLQAARENKSFVMDPSQQQPQTTTILNNQSISIPFLIGGSNSNEMFATNDNSTIAIQKFVNNFNQSESSLVEPSAQQQSVYRVHQAISKNDNNIADKNDGNALLMPITTGSGLMINNGDYSCPGLKHTTSVNISHANQIKNSLNETINLNQIQIDCINSAMNPNSEQSTDDRSLRQPNHCDSMIHENDTSSNNISSNIFNDDHHQNNNNNQTESNSNSSSTNIPIYENQSNLTDLTIEQRKKLLPPYKKPPDYDTYLKNKYLLMNSMSQSMSSIPTHLTSHLNNPHKQMNSISSSSASSLLINSTFSQTDINSSTNIHNNHHQSHQLPINQQILTASSSSAISVPQLLRQQQQQSSRIVTSRNYADLCVARNQNAEIESANNHQSLSTISEVKSIEPSNSVRNLMNAKIDLIDSRHLNVRFPIISSPSSVQRESMLRTSLALQSTNCVLDREVFRQNNSINLQSAPNPMQKQPYSTSVPDLSFKNCPVNFANNLNQARFLQSLGAKNSSISASNKTGSEPNLMISNEVPNQLECFEQHLLKLSTVRFGLNEDQIPFQSNWPLQTSAMMPKLGKLPEIEAESTIQQSLNNLGDSNRNHNKNTTNQQQHLISPVSSVTSTVTEAPSTMSLSTSIEQDPNRKQETQQDETNQTASNRTFVGRNSNRLIIFGQRCFDDQDFTKEFELLPRMNPTAKFTTASLNENILRNRFRDILPYEENRYF